MARRKIAPADNGFSTEVVAPGRISRTLFKHEAKECIVWNVHNFDLTATQKRTTNARIAADKARVDASPSDIALFVGGDFNFPFEDCANFSLRAPTTSHRKHAQHQHTEARAWPALSSLTELATSQPTHFNKPADSLSILDRVFFWPSELVLPEIARLHNSAL